MIVHQVDIIPCRNELLYVENSFLLLDYALSIYLQKRYDYVKIYGFFMGFDTCYQIAF